MEPYLSRRQLADRAGVALRTVDGWRTKGVRGLRLKAHRIGGRPKFLWRDFEAWQRQLEAKADRRLAGKPVGCDAARRRLVRESLAELGMVV